MSRENRRTRKNHRAIVLLLLTVILLLAGIAAWLAEQLYRQTAPMLVGSWRMRVDCTELACARANAWLRAAELGEQVDAARAMPPLRFEVVLTLGEDGSWSRRVDDDSLEEARRAAGGALAQCFRELLVLRAEAAGRKAESPKEMEAHVQAALGMSAEQLLLTRGPQLLPGAEELRARYEGGGHYEIAGKYIRFDGGESLRFLVDPQLLTLAGDKGTEVYER